MEGSYKVLISTFRLYSGSSGKNGEIVVYQSYGEKERMISMFWKSLHDARFAEYDQEGCEQLM